MASDLSDDLLKTIANSSGRCYSHEGRAMAQEIIRWREAAKKAAQQVPPPAGQPWSSGIPYP